MNRSAMENFKDEYEYSRGKYIVPQKELEEFIEESLKLLKENKQLKDNWNKLRDYLFDIRQRGFELQNLANVHNTEPGIGILMILDKMQKLENGDSNE